MLVAGTLARWHNFTTVGTDSLASKGINLPIVNCHPVAHLFSFLFLLFCRLCMIISHGPAITLFLLSRTPRPHHELKKYHWLLLICHLANQAPEALPSRPAIPTLQWCIPYWVSLTWSLPVFRYFVLISRKDQDLRSLSEATPDFSTWSINTVTVLNTKVNQISSRCSLAMPSILVWKVQWPRESIC